MPDRIKNANVTEHDWAEASCGEKYSHPNTPKSFHLIAVINTDEFSGMEWKSVVWYQRRWENRWYNECCCYNTMNAAAAPAGNLPWSDIVYSLSARFFISNQCIPTLAEDNFIKREIEGNEPLWWIWKKGCHSSKKFKTSILLP